MSVSRHFLLKKNTISQKNLQMKVAALIPQQSVYIFYRVNSISIRLFIKQELTENIKKSFRDKDAVNFS